MSIKSFIKKLLNIKIGNILTKDERIIKSYRKKINRYGKEKTLRQIKEKNYKLREKINKNFYHQLQIEFNTPPVPEWFDHYIDLYHTWGFECKNIFWLERGCYSLLAINDNANILELCCGDGFNTKYFYAVKAKKIIAVDFDNSAIEHANKFNKNSNIDYQICDIRKDMPYGNFDNIIWDAAIEHFTEKEICNIMTHIKERLNTNGILSGYTIVEKSDGKQHILHEYEFKSKEDLLRFLSPYFANVKVFETIYTNRHNLYFYASDGVIPFMIDWKFQINKLK